MEIWAQNSATRRPAFLLRQRARAGFPKDGRGHPGCRPSLSPAWRISPGCPWIDNFRGFGIRFDNTFLLLLHGLFVSFAFAFVSMCRSRQAQCFLQVYRNSLYKRNWHLFRSRPQLFAFCLTLWHPFFTPRWQPPCSAGVHKATVHICMQTPRSQTGGVKAADSGFHFGPCAVRFIHWVACMVLFFANHGTSSF